MAGPTDLVHAVAIVLGVPEPTATLHFRNLREAGLRTVSKRGRGAGNMTVRDAAHLLVAVAGASAVKDTVRPLTYQAQTWVSRGTWEETLNVPEVLALPTEHRFVDGLVALIDSAVSGSLEALASELAGRPVDLANDLDVPFEIEITISEPAATAYIEVVEIERDENGQPNAGESRRMQYGGVKKVAGGNLKFDPPLDLTVHGDLRHQHMFGHKTIQTIGNLLRGP